MQSDWERQLARLGDGNQLIAGLLDNIFPALGISDRLLSRCTSNTPDQGAPDRAKRGSYRAPRHLCPNNTAGGTAGGRADRAIRTYQHLPHADNHPTLHSRLLLRGIGGIGVGGVALVTPSEGKREKSREQEKGQSEAAQGEVRFFVSGWGMYSH